MKRLIWFQGIALIVSALIGIICLRNWMTDATPAFVIIIDSPLFLRLWVVKDLLFIFGIWALLKVENINGWGVVGLLLINISPITELLRIIIEYISPYSLLGLLLWIPVMLEEIAILPTAIGYIMISWFFLKKKSFPQWASWLLLISGCLNAIYGIFNRTYSPFSVLFNLTILSTLIGSLALAVYGWKILQLDSKQLKERKRV